MVCSVGLWGTELQRSIHCVTPPCTANTRCAPLPSCLLPTASKKQVLVEKLFQPIEAYPRPHYIAANLAKAPLDEVGWVLQCTGSTCR